MVVVLRMGKDGGGDDLATIFKQSIIYSYRLSAQICFSFGANFMQFRFEVFPKPCTQICFSKSGFILLKFFIFFNQIKQFYPLQTINLVNHSSLKIIILLFINKWISCANLIIFYYLQVVYNNTCMSF